MATSSSSTLPTINPSTLPGIIPNNGNPTSLYLYTFLATLSLLFIIFGALVARSVHLRRRRNAAILAAVAAGTYVPPPYNGKRRDDPLAPKPVLWEVHIASPSPAHDPEKGWAGLLPVAGATLVPVIQQTPGPFRHSVGSWRASWLPRRFFDRRSQSAPAAAPDLPSMAHPTVTTGLVSSLEPPASSPQPPPEPVDLAVLILMPTRTASGSADRGPPVVEFGVAHVAYAHPTGDLKS